MATVLITTALVLAIIYAVPFLVYALGTVVADLKPPEGSSPARFLISVLVSKVGMAFAFVFIFFIARTSLSGQWQLYALAWLLMLVIGEVGQAIGPGYSRKEAIAGVISEAIYVPLSAYAASRMIGL